MRIHSLKNIAAFAFAAAILACAGGDESVDDATTQDDPAATEVVGAETMEGAGDPDEVVTDDTPAEPGAGEDLPAEELDASSIAADLTGEAPALYRARFETSEGNFVVEVHRDWAPNGADRFYNLVRNGYFDGVRFFRVIDGFMAQFGINGDPEIAAELRTSTFQDDPVVEGNLRGRVTFAMSSLPNSRTSQVFINYTDNSRLDASGFAAFGEVVEGMEVVDALHAGYGEGAPNGAGPDQGMIQSQGNDYLDAQFPELDHVERATIIEP